VEHRRTHKARRIRTQLRSAEDCGAELKFGEKVVTFNSSAFGVTVTTDSGERYDAEKLLLAVGAWMPGFLPERLRQHFSVTRQFLHWFEIQTNSDFKRLSGLHLGG
jgi:hypothetical protein